MWRRNKEKIIIELSDNIKRFEGTLKEIYKGEEKEIDYSSFRLITEKRLKIEKTQRINKLKKLKTLLRHRKYYAWIWETSLKGKSMNLKIYKAFNELNSKIKKLTNKLNNNVMDLHIIFEQIGRTNNKNFGKKDWKTL